MVQAAISLTTTAVSFVNNIAMAFFASVLSCAGSGPSNIEPKLVKAASLCLQSSCLILSLPKGSTWSKNIVLTAFSQKP